MGLGADGIKGGCRAAADEVCAATLRSPGGEFAAGTAPGSEPSGAARCSPSLASVSGRPHSSSSAAASWSVMSWSSSTWRWGVMGWWVGGWVGQGLSGVDCASVLLSSEGITACARPPTCGAHRSREARVCAVGVGATAAAARAAARVRLGVGRGRRHDLPVGAQKPQGKQEARCCEIPCRSRPAAVKPDPSTPLRRCQTRPINPPAPTPHLWSALMQRSRSA
jgi:hypothetical protein